ncbi:lysophospholipid acyltransferase family protein [Salinibius halmophilus]|uniref:lysophospholipid acyltransferase family protein n=1 Tax=Salinibius halmophilus TaxID=1853216 RepID=UPI000E671DA6|nr:lysophospholipid acyltransferase family protein [Salinibius halmophilus]
MNFLRTFIFYACFYGPFTISWSIISLLIALPLKPQQRYRVVIGVWASFSAWAARWVLGINYRIEGVENLPNEPVVIAANHQSAWETFFLQKLLQPQTQVVKRSLLKIPFFGWAFAMANPIAIDRTDGRAALNQIIEQGGERLKQGFHVLIFPEGTRKAHGEAGDFKQGGFMLAKKTNAKILPVAHNAGKFWPAKGFSKRPGTIVVRILPAVDIQEGKLAAHIKQIEKQVCEAIEP